MEPDTIDSSAVAMEKPTAVRAVSAFSPTQNGLHRFVQLTVCLSLSSYETSNDGLSRLFYILGPITHMHDLDNLVSFYMTPLPDDIVEDLIE